MWFQSRRQCSGSRPIAWPISWRRFPGFAQCARLIFCHPPIHPTWEEHVFPPYTNSTKSTSLSCSTHSTHVICRLKCFHCCLQKFKKFWMILLQISRNCIWNLTSRPCTHSAFWFNSQLMHCWHKISKLIAISSRSSSKHYRLESVRAEQTDALLSSSQVLIPSRCTELTDRGIAASIIF